MLARFLLVGIFACSVAVLVMYAVAVAVAFTT